MLNTLIFGTKDMQAFFKNDFLNEIV